jgi:ATP-dependent helicase/nuclease subunit B
MQSRVFSIPPGVPFLPALATALLDGTLVPGFDLRADPLALADTVIYLPTRRAARALERVFLDALGGEAALLPRIAPLGDVDEDVLAAEIGFGEAELALAPAIDPLARRIALARLVSRYSAALRNAVDQAVAGGAPKEPSSTSPTNWHA